MVPHVQLTQPLRDAVFRVRVMQGEMQHVVEEIPREEARGDRPRERQLEGHREEEPEERAERHRHRRRHHEPHRVVRMIVMHAVHEEVQAGAEPVIRLEVEDDAVDPVLAERPDSVAAEQAEKRLQHAHVVERANREDRDRRSEDERDDGWVHACEAIERPRFEERRRGPKRLGPGGGRRGGVVVSHGRSEITAPG